MSRRSTEDLSGGSLPGAGGGLWSRKAREQTMMREDRGQEVVRVESEAGDAMRAVASAFEAEVTFKIVGG